MEFCLLWCGAWRGVGSVVMSVMLSLALAVSANAQDHDLRTLDYTAADSVAGKYPGQSLENLPALAYQLTHDLPSDVLKFRAIFKWVCDNIENDYYLFTENQRNRSKLKGEDLKRWNTALQKRMFETLVKKRSTVCTGYAYLIKELCQLSGIRAEIVDGYGRTTTANIGGEGVINHSWTAVLLNDQWYLCDATWASGVIDMTHKQFLKRYDNAYFLSGPEYFIRNHYPADTTWSFLEHTPTLETFLNRPIVYSAAYKYSILPQTPDVFETETTENTFAIHASYTPKNDARVSVMINDQRIQPSTLTFTEISGGTVKIEHKLTKTKVNLVHVMVNGEAVFTYRVVRKKA